MEYFGYIFVDKNESPIKTEYSITHLIEHQINEKTCLPEHFILDLFGLGLKLMQRCVIGLKIIQLQVWLQLLAFKKDQLRLRVQLLNKKRKSITITIT